MTDLNLCACGRDLGAYKTLCNNCRRVGRKAGTLTTHVPPPCKVTDCPDKHRASGYCKRHYKVWKQWGDVALAPGQGKGPRPNRAKPVERIEL